MDTELIDSLSKELKVSKVISHLLISRGVKTYEDAERFFRPQISDLHDPFLMKGMQNAVDRILLAIRKSEKILIYGDYDVDGTTSVSMMYSFLIRFSDNIGYYIPDRYKEGYGVSFKGIDYAQLNDYSLIIALDCGTRAVKQVEYASNKGIDFIICDHHTPGTNIPLATSILNPKQEDCQYPYKELSGCGVGFKLIQAISQSKNISFTEIAEYLDLLTLSIGADIVDMTGENRVLAFYGLRVINKDPRIGIKELIRRSGKEGEISISDLIFGVAPRINAAGRIDHGKIAVELLIQTDQEEARQLSKKIETYNSNRKILDKNITEEALSMIDVTKKSTVVHSQDWHKGVLGIVASRLIDIHYKPTIVLLEEEEVFSGSARSVKGFNIYDALLECDHLLEEFGGHKYAAGLTIKKKNLNQFIDEFEKVVSKNISKTHLENQIVAETVISLEEISSKLYRIIKQFEPFGPKNTRPYFLTKGVLENGEAKIIGKEKNHVKFKLRTENGEISCIGFGMGHQIDKIQINKKFDICYSINENIWNGHKTLQLILRDIHFN